MNWIKKYFRSGMLTLLVAFFAVCLLLLPIFPIAEGNIIQTWIIPPAQADVTSVINTVLNIFGLRVPPRQEEAPTGRRAGGAGRGPICFLFENENQPDENEFREAVIALVPFYLEPEPTGSDNENELEKGLVTRSETEDGDEEENKVPTEVVGGFTRIERPTFWFYVPHVPDPNHDSDTDSGQMGVARFVLSERIDDEPDNRPDSRPVLWDELIAFELFDHPRLVEYTLPYALETGKHYEWYFSVICDAEKPSRNPAVRGWIERADASEDRIWFENLDTLINERRTLLGRRRRDFQQAWTAVLNELQIPESSRFALLEPTTILHREVVRDDPLLTEM